MHHQSIAIHTGKTIEFVGIDQVILIRAENWGTTVFLINQEQLLSTSYLSDFSTALKHLGFFNCHKSYIVNIEHIQRFLREGVIIMTHNLRVPVSRRKKKAFLGVLSKQFE